MTGVAGKCTYEEKYEIIKFLKANPGMKQNADTAKFGLKTQTLSNVLKKIIDTC